MIYIFHILDKAGPTDQRAAARADHKAYLRAVAKRIAFAGPLVSDDGEAIIGSLLAIDFPSRAEAVAWITAEPYYRSGLYAGVTVHAFRNLWPQCAGFPEV